MSSVPNDYVQEFNLPPNTSSSVELSSINSNNVTDEDSRQVKSSREDMKEMLENRCDKKLTINIPVRSGRKFSHESDLDFCDRTLGCMEKEDNSFNETMRGL